MPRQISNDYPIHKYLPEYLNYCKFKGLTERTIKGYEYTLWCFGHYGITWLDRHKPVTKDNHIGNINIFLKWLGGYRLLPRLRLEEPPIKFWTKEEIDFIHENTSDPWVRKYYRFLEVTGCRTGELKLITDYQGGWLHIGAGTKGKRWRQVPLKDESLYEVVKNPKYSYQPWENLKKIRKKLGVNKSLHSFRHTCALRWVYDLGVERARILLGHKDIRTTMHYARFEPEYIKELI